MATSSRFIQLSSSVLMEYIYADQSEINQPSNPYRISTTQSPIRKTKNDYNNQAQILNSDAAEQVFENLPKGTGNVRNRSFAIIEPYRAALLDIDKTIYYNDYDPKLTPSSQLPILFDTPKAPVYDTIKLHLVQGFNFENTEGLTLTLKISDKADKKIVICNLVYNKSDLWETMNPAPFFFGGKVYNSYLEVRILSTYNLIYDYWLGVLTGDTVVERITNQVGIKKEQLISAYFSFVSAKTRIDGQDYIDLVNTVSVDLPIRDHFETISATINESTTGDYIEFYASHSGQIIENFITDLNNSGYDFIILHDLTQFEYIWDSQNNTYYWIKTTESQISQVDNFGEPNVYRPIVKNSSAIAFKLDYVVRLFNRNDNSQIWKIGSMQSNNAAKYGRKLKAINLGTNPVQTKIYNQNIVKDISINRIVEPVLNNVKYITSFTSNTSVSASFANNSNTSTQGFNSATSSQIYDNGLGRILIPESTTFLKFNLFSKVDRENRALNLASIGSLYLVFKSNESEDIEIKEFPNQTTNKAVGEVVFRLSSNDSRRILGLNKRTFQIFLENDAKDRTFIYSGKFYNQEEYQTLLESDKIKTLESQLISLTDQIKDLTLLTNSQQDAINNITSQNNSFLSALANTNQDQTTVTSLQTTINQLNNQVNELTKSINMSLSKLLSANGLNSYDMIPEVKAVTSVKLNQPALEKIIKKNLSNLNSDKADQFTNK